jgi:hypothetical protein
VTTPREQLIDAIAEKSETWFGNGIDTSDELDRDSIGRMALHALSDLGAIVLMPISPADLEYTEPGQATCFVEAQIFTVHDGYVLDGGSHYMASDTVYIDAQA